MTPLHVAARDEDLSAVNLLIDAGADPNARDNNRKTPLHWAAERKTPAVVKALLDAGADPNARDNNGKTPLHSAVADRSPAEPPPITRGGDTRFPAPLRHRTLEVVKALLDARADLINAQAKNGSTPLHWAAALSEIPEVVKALVDAGAGSDARDEGGHTPLHWAARWSIAPAVVQVLRDAGADSNAQAKDGSTPFSVAKENWGLRVPGVAQAICGMLAGNDPNHKTRID